MKLTNKVGYSAIAAAVSLACGAAYAATITGPGVTFSAEGNATSAATARYDAAVTSVVAADYIANDTVTLTLTNGEFQSGTATNAVATSNVTCTGPNGTMVLGFLSRSGTAANYRVTGVTGTAQVGATCAFTAPILRRSMGTAGAVTTLAWSANTAQSQIAFDVAAAPATIGTARTQFTSPSSITTLNGIVDVDSGRFQFTADDGVVYTGTEDTLSFTTQNRSDDGAATLTSIVAVISGDFSFLDNNGSAGCQVGDLTTGHGRASATGGTLSVNSACSALTYTQTTAGAASITLGAASAATGTAVTNGSVFTAPQSFSVAPLTYAYAGASGGSTGSGAVNFSSTGSAGAWALNGASVKIGYMPYGTGISRIVYLTNRSTQSGGIEVTAINDAGEACPAFSGGTSTAGSVTNLSAALDAGVAACYGADFRGKVAFDITANVPANRAEVYSAYNVNGDRVAVINDSNGK